MGRDVKQLSGVEIGLEIKLEKEAMIKETITTAVSKVQLVKDIKSGLGSEIKQTGGRVTIIKKNRYEKFMIWLKKIFTKF
jgi:predicted site-specific integrase-resolvase